MPRMLRRCRAPGRGQPQAPGRRWPTTKPHAPCSRGRKLWALTWRQCEKVLCHSSENQVIYTGPLMSLRIII